MRNDRVVRCRTCDREVTTGTVAGSNPTLAAVYQRQLSQPSGVG